MHSRCWEEGKRTYEGQDMGHDLLRWNFSVVLQKMAGWRVDIFHVFRQPAGTTGAGPLRLSIHSRLTPMFSNRRSCSSVMLPIEVGDWKSNSHGLYTNLRTGLAGVPRNGTVIPVCDLELGKVGS